MIRSRTFWLLACATACALLLAACGGDDDDSNAGDDATTAASNTGAPGPGPIDACTLLGESDLAPLLGEVGDSHGGGNATDVFSCTWSGAEGEITTQAVLQVSTTDGAEAELDAFKDRDGVESVDDLGDEAYVQLGEKSGDVDYVQNTMIARSGDYFLTLASGGTVEGDGATTALSAAMQSAIAALPSD